MSIKMGKDDYIFLNGLFKGIKHDARDKLVLLAMHEEYDELYLLTKNIKQLDTFMEWLLPEQNGSGYWLAGRCLKEIMTNYNTKDVAMTLGYLQYDFSTMMNGCSKEDKNRVKNIFGRLIDYVE